MLGVLGIGLIVLGVAVLVFVDAPGAVRRLGKRKAAGAAGTADGGAEQVGSGGEGDHDGSEPGSTGHRSGGEDGAPTPRQDPATEYGGLVPGWYRDREYPDLARYWDGTTLSEERRPVQTPARNVQAASTAFVGLPPGWYRDPDHPALARYWDGVTLSEEMRPVLGDTSASAGYSRTSPGQT
jgi:hypothetical protein